MRERGGADAAASIGGESRSPVALTRARTLTRLALWTAAGAVIAGLERMLPQPAPWVKPGLANVAALIVLYVYGWKPALAVNVARVVVVGLFLGTWASPVFVLSLGGAVVTVPVMAGVKTIGRGHVGPVGVSAAGAFAHMLVQFALAGWIIARHSGLFLFAGPSLLLAVAGGVVTGLLAAWLLHRLPNPLLAPC
ncbi:MAG: hypothetical protein MAG453_01933 [Calditrichaeota bacterium]|nr:hypothetical protein [Calditrichota bacterium]